MIRKINKAIIVSIIAILHPLLIWSQAGSLDQSFNSLDVGNGYGDAINGGAITAIVEQPDGKIILGGNIFTQYSNQSRNRIVRVNANGSIDLTFNPGLGANDGVHAISLQPDGKILIAGSFTSYNGVSRKRIARLNADGSLDESFNPGQGLSGTANAMILLSDGRVVVGGLFTTYNGVMVNNLVVLNDNGSISTGFSSGTGLNGEVSSLFLQTDGMILIGGLFSQYNGVTKNNLVRINSSGVLEASFNSMAGPSSRVRSILVQNDGKIIIGGEFLTVNGTSRTRCARLNADGALDGSFSIGSGFGGAVRAMQIQSDGKLCVTGDFYTFNGSSVFGFCRLNTNGTIDAGFNSGMALNGGFGYSLVISSNGSLLLGGVFSTYNRVYRKCIVRLSSAGTLDLSFNSLGTGINGEVIQTIIQPDGKILVSGYFSLYNGISRNCIVRILSDGTIDNTFDPGVGPDGAVYDMEVQPDGKIILAGMFNHYAGVSKNYICRIHSDGTLDNTFNVGNGTNLAVTALKLQADGKVIIGGQFSWYNGIAMNGIARLNINGSLDNTFNVGSGFDAMVQQIEFQSDGKILVAGQFTQYNGNTANQLCRLNVNGTFDNTFSSGLGVGFWEIKSILPLPNGKIVIGGSFQQYNGINIKHLARLNANGTLDNTFNSGGVGPNSVVFSLKRESSGKILMAGMFNNYNNNGAVGLVRIDENGIRDFTYSVGSGATIITAIAVQADDNLVIVGNFLAFNGIGRNRIARINSSSCVSEVCNGVDDDCDGIVDDGLATTDFFLDADGDGYGATSFISSCSQPLGYVLNNIDCADNNSFISPSAIEQCNNLDDDCDGVSDDGMVYWNYYLDFDGDGIGSGSSFVSCVQLVNYVLVDGDCDDQNSNITPVNSEVCFNNVDDNCSGVIDENCSVSANPGDEFFNALYIENFPQFGVGVQNNFIVDLANATPSSFSGGIGNDIWYLFVAESNAVRISLKGSTSISDDNLIQLFTLDPNLPGSTPVFITEEDDVELGNLGISNDGGNEILYFDQLVIGDEYWICIVNGNGSPGSCSLSVSYLKGSQADIGPFTNYTGVYSSTCSNFKAAFRPGAHQYVVNRLVENDIFSTSDWIYTLPNNGTSVASTICQLGKILPSNLTGSLINYYVRVDVEYLVQDAFGNMHDVYAMGNVVSEIGLNSEGDLFLRSTDQCPVFKSVNSSLATNRSVCGTARYTWQFTPQFPTQGLPIDLYGAYGASRIFPISSISGVSNGQRYDVRLRAEHLDGQSLTEFGSYKCFRTLGAAGMVYAESEFELNRSEAGAMATKVYPNPSYGDVVNLWVGDVWGVIEVRVLDSFGRVVFSKSYWTERELITTLHFTNSLAQGVYFIECKYADTVSKVSWVVGQ